MVTEEAKMAQLWRHLAKFLAMFWRLSICRFLICTTNRASTCMFICHTNRKSTNRQTRGTSGAEIYL
jgi:hypothetical protein